MGVQSDEKEENDEEDEKVIKRLQDDYEIIAIANDKPNSPFLYREDIDGHMLIDRDIFQVKLGVAYYEALHKSLGKGHIYSMTKKALERIPVYNPEDVRSSDWIAGHYNDLVIDDEAGEIKVVERDRFKRPALVELEYDFSEKPPEEMPEELKRVLSITPPQYQEALLYELVSPLLRVHFPQYVFINYNNSLLHYEALNVINEALKQLYNNTRNGLVYVTSDYELFHQRICKTDYMDRKAMFRDIDFLEKQAIVIEITKHSLAKKVCELVTARDITIKYKEKKTPPFFNNFTYILNVANALDLGPVNTVINSSIVVPVTKELDSYEVERWEFDTREKIVLWLIHNRLLKYRKGVSPTDLGALSGEALWVCIDNKKLDYGLNDFIRGFVCADSQTDSQTLMPTEVVYDLYLKWSYPKYIPVSFYEFERIMWRRNLIQNEKICVSKKALESLKEEH